MNIEKKYIERLKQGSYKDFTHLYNLYAPRLYAFILGLSNSESKSKDVVQETFVKIWIHREHIDVDKSFKSYIFTIAKNHFLTEFRNQLNYSTVDIDTDFLDASLKANPEEQMILDAFNEDLEKAKGKLSPRQREFFELNKEQGLSVSEIAAKTSVSEQSVRNQISQAVGRLRQELQKYSYLFSIFFM